MFTLGRRPILLLSAALALGACGRNRDLFDETGGVRITRSKCPAVAIPAYTGDVTIFSPEQSRDLRALDVTAVITNVQTSCDEAGDTIRVVATFDVLARRSSPSGARQVVLPYFATVTRAGTQIMSKQLGQTVIDFPDGQLRAQARAQTEAGVSRAMTSLPPEIEDRVTRKRKPSDADATVDPLNDPKVRTAVREASFELLIGFQLTDSQLAYNATR